MEFEERINAIAAGIPRQLEHIHTEEATKNALVLPFISALGYDIFDPTEVVPEFTADVGTKKGEKVDYAILRDGLATLIFECKCCECDLDKEHASQLFRYFAVTEARFAILTNGIVYRFYSDVDEPNKMDARPFFELDMRDVRPHALEQLRKFTKSTFAVDEILATAQELKLTTEIKRVMAEQFAEPSDEFVRMLVSRVYQGRITQSVRQQFGDVVKRALHQFVADRVNDTLNAALTRQTAPAPADPASDEPSTDEAPEQGIVTTLEEREAYFIVKAIVRDIVDVGRIAMRDALTYCSVLLDDNNRKPICRLRFNGPQKYLGVFDAQKQETRHRIGDLNEIYDHADQLRATVAYYDNQ